MTPTSASQPNEKTPKGSAESAGPNIADFASNEELAAQLDQYSLESVVEFKVSRFLDQLGNYYPDNLYDLIMKKIEKPLISQILRRVGGNQVHASKILGINRNTLRKKMKMFDL